MAVPLDRVDFSPLTQQRGDSSEVKHQGGGADRPTIFQTTAQSELHSASPCFNVGPGLHKRLAYTDLAEPSGKMKRGESFWTTLFHV